LQAFDGGGLACAVRAEDPKISPRSTWNENVGHRDLARVAVAQVSHFVAGKWCGIDIPPPYLPEPPEPEREADGWYREGSSLYKTPK
jgi:hypothetical protein